MRKKIAIVVFIVIFGTICVSYIKNKTRDLEKEILKLKEVKDRKPIIASEKETRNNNRARSAKLRYAIKIQDHSFEFKRSHLNLEKYFQLEEVIHA